MSRLARPILEKPGNPFITVGSFGLRPRVILQFLVRKDLWENYQKHLGAGAK